MDQLELCDGRAAARAPAVSVIVPAYGVTRFVGEALASLQAQRRADWEAIVVDDGAAEVEAAIAPFAGDPRIRLLKTDNRGLAVARNRAAAAARAPLLSLLDGDDAYEPDYLARMIETIEADPGLGFVSCDATVFGPRRKAERPYSSLYPIAGPISLERVLSREAHIFVGAIIRREAFRRVGGFDPRLAAVEDLDLWIRILAAGWRAAVVPQPLARYRRRANSLSSDPRRMARCACAVYLKAAARAATPAERAAAERMLARAARDLRWLDGERLVLQGQFETGLALLAGSEQRSRRWRLALAVIRRAPRLARVLLRLRPWIPNLRLA